MNQISCDICMDLLPLVNDGVASEDSQKAVLRHIETCDTCKALYTGELPPPNTGRIQWNIRRKLFYVALSLIALGTVYGLTIAAGEFMFYNAFIMPAIGALGYFTLKKQSYFTLIFVFVSVYLRWLWDTLGGFAMGYSLTNIFVPPLWWALIYSGLCGLGLVTAALLHFGFRKEKP